MTDEQAIRTLVDEWLAATRAGDMDSVLKLMADDVIFLVPGQEPFGKEQFKASSEHMKHFRVEAESDIQELQVTGDWAWFRNRLKVSFTPLNGGKAARREGYTLTIMRKRRDGKWELFRDANMLTEVPSA